MIEQFLAALINNRDSQLRAWMGEELMRVKGEQYLNSIIPYITDEVRASGYHGAFYIEGAVPKDYLWKCLEMPSGKKLIAVINFMGLDLGKPFIRVMAIEPLLESIGELEALAAFLKAEFFMFSPPRICVFDGLGKFSEETERLKFDMWNVAAPLNVIREVKFDVSQQLRLEKAVNLDFYEWYEREYHLFLEEHPAHKIWLQLTKREEFQGMIEEETCYLCFLGDLRIGLIAAEYQEEKFLTGYCVYEELIVQTHRGKGYGKQMQQLMIRELPIRDEQDLLWGTIDSGNKISLRTAMACGRKKLGKWIYFNT